MMSGWLERYLRKVDNVHEYADKDQSMTMTTTTRTTINIARIANAVPVTLHSRVTLNVEIVVLNCQK